MSNNCIPWVEFFRPKIFDDIVLDQLNKQILKNNNHNFSKSYKTFSKYYM